MRGIQAQVKLAHQLADMYCQGRWVAVGGGGYDLYRVVPRAWSIVWAEMSWTDNTHILAGEMGGTLATGMVWSGGAGSSGTAGYG